jgi:hypothetical protein
LATLFTFIERVTMSPDERISPYFQLNDPNIYCEVRLDPNAQDWQDTTLQVSVYLQRSLDSGATWQDWDWDTFTGGEMASDGGFPFVGRECLPAEWPTLVRIKVANNKSSRLGFKGKFDTVVP